jgi:hypothetical protein
VPQYTTADLLSDIRVGAMLPDASASTFSDAELLRLADRELQIGLLPLILGMREEYLVHHVDLAFTVSGSEATVRIPKRAIGMKLRDVALVIGPGNYLPLPQLSLEALRDADSGFYVRGDRVVLLNRSGMWSTTTVRLSFLRRPSRLVPTTECAVINAVSPWVTVASYPAAWAAGPCVPSEVAAIGSNTGLSWTLTGSLSSPVRVVFQPFTLGGGSYFVRFYVNEGKKLITPDIGLAPVAPPNWVLDLATLRDTQVAGPLSTLLAGLTLTLTDGDLFDEFTECDYAFTVDPSATGTLYDLVRASPGYESLADDVTPLADYTFPTFTAPTDVEVGDYVCLAGESCVPQIPVELQPVLAQRVIVKVLEAIGDAAAVQTAQGKLLEAEAAAKTLLTPRVDGEPKMFRNPSSPFRSGAWGRTY